MAHKYSELKAIFINYYLFFNQLRKSPTVPGRKGAELVDEEDEEDAIN